MRNISHKQQKIFIMISFELVIPSSRQNVNILEAQLASAELTLAANVAANIYLGGLYMLDVKLIADRSNEILTGHISLIVGDKTITKDNFFSKIENFNTCLVGELDLIQAKHDGLGMGQYYLNGERLEIED